MSSIMTKSTVKFKRPSGKQPVIVQILPALVSGGVERGTVEMAKAIQKLLDDPEGTRRLGQNARAFVLGECTWDSRAEELEALYSTFLDETARGRSRPQMPQ